MRIVNGLSISVGYDREVIAQGLADSAAAMVHRTVYKATNASLAKGEEVAASTVKAGRKARKSVDAAAERSAALGGRIASATARRGKAAVQQAAIAPMAKVAEAKGRFDLLTARASSRLDAYCSYGLKSAEVEMLLLEATLEMGPEVEAKAEPKAKAKAPRRPRKKVATS